MKTPIEWLTEKLNEQKFITESQIHIAKEIEKQQIELAFLVGKHNGIQICQYNSKVKEIEAEQYYNETYKNETT
jgi:hypothetical protein